MNVSNIAVIGSTGSIGKQTMDVVRAFPDRFRVVGLAAGYNVAALAAQVTEFRPLMVCSLGELPTTGYEPLVVSVEVMAAHPEVDVVVIAAAGRDGLAPTLAAVKAGKRIALANKESLVAAGAIVTGAAQASGAEIRPVDSEHSAIWQCLRGETKNSVTRLILTASGGPFYGWKPAELENITVEQALGHPTWHMGPKVTIDSATLMNKGLEVIEAHWLFDIPYDNITVRVHPQSVVHSMVEFVDGSVKGQLGSPDMRLPIQYALSYPERWPNPELPQLDWSVVKQLEFDAPDTYTFPCLRLAIEAGRRGDTYPAVLCAADEVAVGMFLERQINFTDIARLVELALDEHHAVASPDVDAILAADSWARDRVAQYIRGVKP
jgi:1-deoxy-D-xylulose-5-phosphate reductoisomerase